MDAFVAYLLSLPVGLRVCHTAWLVTAIVAIVMCVLEVISAALGGKFSAYTEDDFGTNDGSGQNFQLGLLKLSGPVITLIHLAFLGALIWVASTSTNLATCVRGFYCTFVARSFVSHPACLLHSNTR